MALDKSATYEAVESEGLPRQGIFIPPHAVLDTSDLLSATKKEHFADRCDAAGHLLQANCASHRCLGCSWQSSSGSDRLATL